MNTTHPHKNDGTMSSILNVFLQSAGTFSETIMIPQKGTVGKGNVFGRVPEIVHGRSLARVLGSSLAGLRSSVLMEDVDLLSNLRVIKEFSRLHVPLTMVVVGDPLRYLPAIAPSGSMVFRAGSHQELMDRILAGQVISEKALAPVVILCSRAIVEMTVTLPDPKTLRNWFGDPDGRVPDPTHSQGMVLGHGRRRMPSWINSDIPVQVGGKRGKMLKDLELTSHREFDRSHWQDIIDQTLTEFSGITGRELPSYRYFGKGKVRNLVITTSLGSPLVDTIVGKDILRKESIGFIDLHQLYPVVLPEVPWKKLQGLLVTEPAVDGTDQGWLFRQVLPNVQIRPPRLRNGWYVGDGMDGHWMSAIATLFSGDERESFWIDVHFVWPKCDLPKQQALMEEVLKGYEDLKSRSLEMDNEVIVPLWDGVEPSPHVRQFADKGPPYSRLSHFFNSTALLYEEYPQHLLAGPHLGYPVLPPRSSMLRKPVSDRKPILDPMACTACMECLPACPYGALPATLQTWESVIKAGIQGARSNGAPIAQVVPLMKTWVKNATGLSMEASNVRKGATHILVESFEQTVKGTKADEEKASTLRNESEAIIDALGEVNLTFSRSLFEDREKNSKGSGLLFSLAADPDACSGCGACVEVCPENALSWSEEKRDIEKRSRAFEALPDTSIELLSGLKEEEVISPMSANLLHQSYYRALLGVFGNDEARPEIGLMRVILSLVKEESLTGREAILKTISSRHSALKNTIKKILGDALPTARLESLSEVLGAHDEERLSMDRILSEWGQEEAFQSVDRANLDRKLSLSRSLQDLKWMLEKGVTGMGRSGFTVVMDDRLGGEDDGIWNSFEVPVIRAEHQDLPSVAIGVYNGQLRHSLDNIRLLRRATLEGNQKYERLQHDPEIAGLTWEDLTTEERSLVPPVVILTLDGDLFSSDWSRCLQGDRPIRVFSLVKSDPDPDMIGSGWTTRNSLAHVAQDSYSVAQTSLHDPDHLYSCVRGALNSDGGSLVRIWSPVPGRMDIHPAKWMSLYPLAVSTRDWVPFRYSPGSEFISQGIAVKPEDTGWEEVTLKYHENEEEKEAPYTLTWADWAFLHRSWRAYFEPDPEGDLLPVGEYLVSDAEERKEKIPVILRVGEDSRIHSYGVAPEVISQCERVLRSMSMLSEWGGLTTQFPDKLKELVHQELEVEFEEKRKAMEKDYLSEKGNWEDNYRQELREQIKDRLMKMSGQ